MSNFMKLTTAVFEIYWKMCSKHAEAKWLNLLHFNCSCCLERFYMGKLTWTEYPLTNQLKVKRGEKEHNMHTVFAMSLWRAYQVIPFHVVQFSEWRSYVLIYKWIITPEYRRAFGERTLRSIQCFWIDNISFHSFSIQVTNHWSRVFIKFWNIKNSEKK